MKLEVEMYVRTEDGYVDKLLKLDSNVGTLESWRLKKLNTCYPNDSFLKSSHNIIDLIEVGDVIITHNGRKHEVVRVAIDKDFKVPTKRIYTYDDWNLSVDEIKSIVTKEQFASMEYILEKEV